MDKEKWIYELEILVEYFYQCTTLGIAGFTGADDLICTRGISDEWLDLLMEANKKRKTVSDYPVIHIPEYGDFITVSVDRHSIDRGYIILGPFSESAVASKGERPFKIIPYFVQLIRSIQDHMTFKECSIKDLVSNRVYNLHVQRALNYTSVHYSEEIPLEKMAEELGLNKSYFSHLFRKETGVTFCHWLNRVRIQESKELLKHTHKAIAEIAIEVGYTSQSYYTSTFKKLVGITPKTYRQDFTAFTGGSS